MNTVAVRETARLRPGRAPAVSLFEPEPPIVRPERILRIQGYSNLDRVRPAITSAARDMALLAQSLTRSQVAYQYVPVVALDDTKVELAGGRRLCCAAFKTRLAGCFEVVPFVLSCGQAMGQTIVEMADRGDLLEAVLLESAGWLCIEDATRQFKELLRSEAAARGCRTTSRVGPGYVYRVGNAEVSWPLEDQVELFGLFKDAQLPVQLMPSCAMNPKLSRSGLYGIAPLANAADSDGAGLLN